MLEILLTFLTNFYTFSNLQMLWEIALEIPLTSSRVFKQISNHFLVGNVLKAPVTSPGHFKQISTLITS